MLPDQDGIAVDVPRPPLIVDDREDREVYDYLVKLGIPLEVRRLEYGDYAFEGHGAKGACMVGVERKKIRDLLASMQSDRFGGHQAPGMVNAYEYRFLALEGIVRSHPETGVLEEARRDRGWFPVRTSTSSWMHRTLDNYLTSVMLQFGMHVKQTANPRETAQMLKNLYWYFQKGWGEHRSAKVIYGGQTTVSAHKPGLVRRVATQLAGIGWEKSAHVSLKFRSVVEMALALPEEWRSIPGIGAVLSERIVKALNGEYED